LVIADLWLEATCTVLADRDCASIGRWRAVICALATVAITDFLVHTALRPVATIHSAWVIVIAINLFFNANTIARNLVAFVFWRWAIFICPAWTK